MRLTDRFNLANYTATELAVARVMCDDDLLFYSRFMYKATQNQFFRVGKQHQIIAETLEKVERGELKRVIFNLPPRYGKTELAIKQWISRALGKNPAAKFLHLSYSNDLALENSDEVRDICKSDVYKTLYPGVKISPKSDSKKKWYTTERGGVYATSTGGQVTGFGAGSVYDGLSPEQVKELVGVEDDAIDGDLLDGADFIANEPGEFYAFNGAVVIDDPQKPEDADNPILRKKINDRFRTTIKNRVNSRNTPIIVIMQRLDIDDLSGYLINEDKDDYTVITMPAMQPDGTALDPLKHTVADLEKLRAEDPETYDKQYDQNPTPKKGLLYETFKEWSELPETILHKRNQTDSAESGTDFVCSINYVVGKDGLIYVTNIYFSDETPHVTEVGVARCIINDDYEEPGEVYIEANAGGEAFARNVAKYIPLYIKVHTPYQSKNKEAKIISNAPGVNKLVCMPPGWRLKYPAFYKHITRFKKKFRANEHDDGADVLSEIVIREGKKKRKKGNTAF